MHARMEEEYRLALSSSDQERAHLEETIASLESELWSERRLQPIRYCRSENPQVWRYAGGDGVNSRPVSQPYKIPEITSDERAGLHGGPPYAKPGTLWFERGAVWSRLIPRDVRCRSKEGRGAGCRENLVERRAASPRGGPTHHTRDKIDHNLKAFNPTTVISQGLRPSHAILLKHILGWIRLTSTYTSPHAPFRNKI